MIAGSATIVLSAVEVESPSAVVRAEGTLIVADHVEDPLHDADNSRLALAATEIYTSQAVDVIATGPAVVDLRPVDHNPALVPDLDPVLVLVLVLDPDPDPPAALAELHLQVAHLPRQGILAMRTIQAVHGLVRLHTAAITDELTAGHLPVGPGRLLDADVALHQGQDRHTHVDL